MTPAKPQHMAGQTNDADDLIAELTKLMATDAKPASTPAPRPVQAVPTPPAAAQPPAPSTIRIPGMSQPVPAAPPSGGVRFDFSRPPAPAAAAPAPPAMPNWTDRLGAKSNTATPFSTPAPAAPAVPTPPAPRPEPTPPASVWRPAIAPGEAERDAASSAAAFDFDFGFNRSRPETPAKASAAKPAASPAPPPVPAALPAAAPAAVRPTPSHDPIADLIAAELGPDATRMPASTFAPVVVAARPAPPVAVPSPPADVAPPPVRIVPPSAEAPANRVQPPPPDPRASSYAVRPSVESDRFSTAPVFGLGGKPSGDSAPRRVEPDPMDEIENLIGEAVRVELTAQPTPQVVRPAQSVAPARALQPQPAVPPLNTQFAPRRTTLREPEPAPHGADDAILAAAAATGAEVGRIEPGYAEERPKVKKQPARRQRLTREPKTGGGAFRQLVVPAIAGTILLAGGLGLYWALGMGHHDGKAPILTADVTPAKQMPAKPAAGDGAHSVVLDQLSGTTPPANSETLVSRDQSSDAAPAQVAAAPAAADAGDSGLANRKVRTVTVRPDGTIVSGDDTVAGAAKLPVDRPNVPVVPGIAVANAAEAPLVPPSPAVPTDGATADSTDAGTTAAAAAVPPTVPMPAPAATADAPTPADAASAATPPSDAPVPMPRLDRSQPTQTADAQVPSIRPTSPVNAVIRNGNPAGAQPVDLIGNLAAASDPAPPPRAAAAKPATRPLFPAAPATQVATADPPAATGSGGNGHVQLSSQTSEAAAQASANALQKRFGGVWGDGRLQVVKVDLGSKGIYYRVMLATSSSQDALSICSSIKSSGGDCVANR